jgi:hypothetical protein
MPRIRSDTRSAPIPPAEAPPALPYVVEVWGRAPKRLQEVAGKALDLEIARAIFKAAKLEHPESLVVLRRGRTIVETTA